MTNGIILDIIPVFILPEPRIAERFAASSRTLHARQKISSKEIVTDAARSGARIFKDAMVVNCKDTYRTIQRDGNNSGMPPILTTQVQIGAGTSVYLTRMGSQDIDSPSGSIGPQEVRDAQPLDTSIIGIYAEHMEPAPTWSKATVRKFSDKSSSDVYSRCWMKLMHDAVLTESPNFINLGLSYVHTLDELISVFITITRIVRLTDGPNWLPTGHIIGEVTADRVSRMRSEQNYSAKTDFETRGQNQDSGRQNNSTSRPPLGSTPLGTNTNNGTT